MIWGVKTNPYFWKDPDLHYTYCGYPVGIVTYQILPEMEDLNIPNCLHPRKRLRMSGAKNSKRKGLNVSQVTIFQGTFVSLTLCNSLIQPGRLFAWATLRVIMDRAMVSGEVSAIQGNSSINLCGCTKVVPHLTPLTEGRSARDLTQAATSQKKNKVVPHRSPIGRFIILCLKAIASGVFLRPPGVCL